jgi:CysZ protein
MKFNFDNKKLNNPAYGAASLLKGLGMLRLPGLRRFIIFPVLINLVLFAFGFIVLQHYFAELMAWLIPDWLDWLRWLLWPLFGLSFILVTYFFFVMFANLIAAPFYGLLAENAAIILSGNKLESKSALPAMKTVLPAVMSELGRMTYFITRAVPLLVLFMVPGLNIVAPFLWFLFGAWFFALDYSSYPLEPHGVLFKEQRQLMKKKRLGALGFGSLLSFCLAVPVLNLFIPPAAVIGATAYFIDASK